MRTRAALLLVLMVAAPLASLMVPPAQGAPPNRPPVVWAGPDQNAESSPLACFNDLDACNFVTINTRYDGTCRIHDKTYDPDFGPDTCGSLRFGFRATPFPCNPDPLNGGGVPCVPIGDGSKYIDFTSAEELEFQEEPAFIEAQNCARQSGYDPGDAGAPTLEIEEYEDAVDDLGNELAGIFRFVVPPLPPGQFTECIYSIDVMASDGKPHPKQPTPPAAGITDETMDVDTVIVTVRAGPSPPFPNPAVVRTSVCTGPLSDPDATCRRSGGVNIVTQHGMWLRFQFGNAVLPVVDDKEVRGVQVLLNGMELDQPHNILVPLTVKQILLPYQASPPQVEASIWFGDLPVDTPALTVGTWQINGRVFDADGGILLYEGLDEEGEVITLGELEVASDPLAADNVPNCLDLNDPDFVSPGTAPCIALSLAQTTTAPTYCYDGFPSVPTPYAIGHGESIRPEILWGHVNPADEDPKLAPIFDHGLMGWKVTYQSCVLSDDNVAIYGPEVELRYPYFMSIDTLFRFEQEVAIRAYDRLGNDVTALVIPITRDTNIPVFAMDTPLLQTPMVTYEGIPFQMVTFVHDRIPTAVSLHINAIDRTDEGKAVAYDSVLLANQPGGAGGTAVTLPRLSSMVQFDIFGQQDYETVCDYLIDWDADDILDAYYHWPTHTLGVLVPEGDAGEAPDYLVDLNGNGAADLDELVIRGAEGEDMVLDANRCKDPFEEAPHLKHFLSTEPTQVFAFNVKRDILGATAYRFTIQDIVFNRVAKNACPANDPDDKCIGVDGPTSYLAGTLETFHAVVDASIVSMAIVPVSLALEIDESKPDRDFILAGDPVVVRVVARQESRLVPTPAPGTEPVVPMLVVVTDVGQAECRDPTDEVNCLSICPATLTSCTPVPTEAGVDLSQLFQRPIPQLSPDVIDPYNIVPDFYPPGLVTVAASSYRPGQHQLVGTVLLDDSVTDEDPSNDAGKLEFEVYLGQVVIGAFPAGTGPTGRIFYIRTNANTGLPAPAGGAVEVDDAYAIVDRHDLNFNQTGVIPRYDFTYTENGETKRAWFEPQTRYSRTFGKDCKDLTEAEKVIDYTVDPPLDPDCRFITVITPGSGEEEDEQTAPLPMLPLYILALVGVALLRRRK